MNRKFHIKKGDLVQVNAGEDKGKQGKVLATSPKADTVTVEGVRMQKKHEKARKANETSKIVEVPGPVDASNVMVVCPTCGKATKVKHAIVDGKKVRVCKCGATLDKAFVKKSKATAAAESEAPKKRTRKRAAKAEETKTETPSANE